MRTSGSLLCATLLLVAIISTVAPRSANQVRPTWRIATPANVTNDGTSFACTRRGCPPKPEGGKQLERHTRGRPKKCEPGETHMEDCNTCKCNDDGTSFACTSRACPPKPEGGKQLVRHTRRE
uniref:Pacifastin domain-containing protein n=1 Tax=Timema monikensis TaxID=170555 RepID=A0A7R9EAX1_9NEOP|nr:unnamed protein product [Timema monikensis]